MVHLKKIFFVQPLFGIVTSNKGNLKVQCGQVKMWQIKLKKKQMYVSIWNLIFKSFTHAFHFRWWQSFIFKLLLVGNCEMDFLLVIVSVAGFVESFSQKACCFFSSELKNN